MSFQLRRSVKRIATLVAIETFLCIIMKIVDLKLVGHLDIFLFLARAIADNALGRLVKSVQFRETIL